MHWPSDHPVLTDAPLAAWAAGVDEVAPRASFECVLRHLPGRRVASRVRRPDGSLAVLKVFASPRARGNDRRLRALHDSPAGWLAPQTLGVDRAGHVALVSWVAGSVLDELGDRAFVDAAGAAGRSLRTLHRSGTRFDRSWTLADEMAQLARRATPRIRPLVDHLVANPAFAAALVDEPMAPAHRDCHPRQAVVDAGIVRWIDLDDCAMAPIGLDVGNFIAHLRRDSVIGRRSEASAATAVAAFVDGYGEVPPMVPAWELLALVRLVGLAESRHGRSDWATAILDLAVEAVARNASTGR